MRAVFQSHIKGTTALRAHWGIWHSSYPVAKQERIKIYEQKSQAAKWHHYLVCQEQGWAGPIEYYGLASFK